MDRFCCKTLSRSHLIAIGREENTVLFSQLLPPSSGCSPSSSSMAPVPLESLPNISKN